MGNAEACCIRMDTQWTMRGRCCLTVIEDEVCKAYPVGVATLKGCCIEIYKGCCGRVQCNLGHSRTLPAHSALEPGICSYAVARRARNLLSILPLRSSACGCRAIATYSRACSTG